MNKIAKDLLRDVILESADCPEGVRQDELHMMTHVGFRKEMGYGISCPNVLKHIDQLTTDEQLEVIDKGEWILRKTL